MDLPKIILCDCDGVLTDGKFWVDHNGNVSKAFHTRDVRAIRELISRGYEFYIITASSWEGAESFAKKTGAVIKVVRDKESETLFLPVGEYIAIGDDSWDFKMIENTPYRFCPKDSLPLIKEMDGIKVLEAKGGEGCIADLLNYL